MPELVRLIIVVPLAVITYQAVTLRRMLPSRAWSLIAGGFVVFLLVTLTGFFTSMGIYWRLGFTLFGYGLVAAGFHMLRNDLRGALRQTRKEP